MPENGSFTVDVEHGGVVKAAEGRRLVLALEDAGQDILHRCGGNARCATCRVEILAGEPTPITEFEELRLAELSGREATTRLSCQVRVTSDLSVRICNRLSAKPELGDAGPRPIEWPRDTSLAPDS
jgi:ferredoxin